MYQKYVKRILDCSLSLLALIVLSPVLLILTILGAIIMKGNPFFTQLRPGKDEKIFKLIKFRTMTNAKDKNGNLLPSKDRLVLYGKVLRSTSLDELPELFNIIKGDMSIVGPRPLLVEYLELYNEKQKRRHSVKPGLTGLAQIKGRNSLTWNERFEYDIEYVENITFFKDVMIIVKTIEKVIKRENINPDNTTIMKRFNGKN